MIRLHKFFLVFTLVVTTFIIIIFVKHKYSAQKWIKGGDIDLNYFTSGDIIAFKLTAYPKDTLIGYFEGWKQKDTLYVFVLENSKEENFRQLSRKVILENFGDTLSKIAIKDITQVTTMYFNLEHKTEQKAYLNSKSQVRKDPRFEYGILILCFTFIGWLWADKRLRPFITVHKVWRIFTLLLFACGLSYVQLGLISYKVLLYFIFISVLYILLSYRYGLFIQKNIFELVYGVVLIIIIGLLSETIIGLLESQNLYQIIVQRIQFWVVISILFFVFNLLNSEILRAQELRRSMTIVEKKSKLTHPTFDLNDKLLKRGLSAIAEGKLTNNQPEEMAMALADYYRYTTNRKNEVWSSVRKEKEALNALLKVDELISGMQVKSEIDIHQEIIDVIIPKFILLDVAVKVLHFSEGNFGIPLQIQIKKFNTSHISLKVFSELEGIEHKSISYYDLTKDIQNRLSEIYENNWQILFEKLPIFGVKLILPHHQIN